MMVDQKAIKCRNRCNTVVQLQLRRWREKRWKGANVIKPAGNDALITLAKLAVLLWAHHSLE